MKKTGLLLIAMTIILAGSTFAQEKKEAKASKKSEKEHIVVISTEYGDIKLKLYNETPIHRDNFLKLAKEGKYNGSNFHRVIQGFMIQGGGMAAEGSMEQLPAEIVPGLYHKRGALAAARLGDDVNPQKKSSPSQFYIVQGTLQNQVQLDQLTNRKGSVFTAEAKQAYMTEGGAPHLDGDYTVFGEVIEGMDVVDKIAACQKKGSAPVKTITFTVKVLQ